MKYSKNIRKFERQNKCVKIVDVKMLEKRYSMNVSVQMTIATVVL